MVEHRHCHRRCRFFLDHIADWRRIAIRIHRQHLSQLVAVVACSIATGEDMAERMLKMIGWERRDDFDAGAPLG